MSIRLKKKKHASRAGEFRQLKALGDEIVASVDSRLLAGDSARSVARGLHKGGHLLEMKEEAIAKALTRYRGSELRDKTLERIANVQSGVAVAQIVQRLNAHDELEGLVYLQKGRVTTLLSKESDLPKGIVLKDASSEMRLLKDMLVDLGKLQLETGILQKASKTYKGQVQGADGQLHSFEWTEEQEQLYQTIEAMAQNEAFSAEDR